MNCLVTIPIGVVSTRIQTATRGRTGIIATFQRIIEEDGLQGLWSGLRPSLILTINPAITYLAYEKLKGLPLTPPFYFFVSLGQSSPR